MYDIVTFDEISNEFLFNKIYIVTIINIPTNIIPLSMLLLIH